MYEKVDLFHFRKISNKKPCEPCNAYKRQEQRKKILFDLKSYESEKGRKFFFKLHNWTGDEDQQS
jgi:hypothetical protein